MIPTRETLSDLSHDVPGVSEERIAARPCDESARPTGLAKRGYLTVEMGSQARRAPRQRPYSSNSNSSSCPGGAGEFKVAAVARLYPALAVGQPEIISSSSPFFLVTPLPCRSKRQISPWPPSGRWEDGWLELALRVCGRDGRQDAHITWGVA